MQTQRTFDTAVTNCTNPILQQRPHFHLQAQLQPVPASSCEKTKGLWSVIKKSPIGTII